MIVNNIQIIINYVEIYDHECSMKFFYQNAIINARIFIIPNKIHTVQIDKKIIKIF